MLVSTVLAVGVGLADMTLCGDVPTHDTQEKYAEPYGMISSVLRVRVISEGEKRKRCARETRAEGREQ